MRFARLALLCIFAAQCIFATGQGLQATQARVPSASESAASILRLPIAFEPNVGQGFAEDRFVTHAGPLQIGFGAGALHLDIPLSKGNQRLEMSLEGAHLDATVTPSEPTGGESNYLVGPSPSSWKTHIPQYGRVTYHNVYDGVDLLFYGNGGHIEHDFVVQPNADLHQIRLRYANARGLTLDGTGDLHVSASNGDLIVHAPRIYQRVRGHEQTVDGGFALLPDHEVSFTVGKFDPALPLVIDPVLDFATYLADLSISVAGAAVDGAGNTYIVGETFSQNFPVSQGVVQPTCGSCVSNQGDVFVTKLNAAGTAQLYSTFLGGNGNDQPAAIAVDASGNALITGFTGSTDFPSKNPISSGQPGYEDGFVTSLTPDGASLNFSSRLGGIDAQTNGYITFGQAVAFDAAGAAYVSGTTDSPYMPVSPGALNAGTPGYPNNYIFLTKLTASGALTYSAIVGETGSISDCCSVASLAVDATGNTYLAGSVGVTTFTTTTPWPTTPGAYQTTILDPNVSAPFVTKVSPDGSALVFSTLVTTGNASGMALASDGSIWLAGTGSTGLPVNSASYSTVPGTSFLAKLSADGTQLPYATYFSTPTGDTGGTISKIALDAAGDVWVAGNTGYRSNIPLLNPLQSVAGTSSFSTGSAFLTEFDPQVHQVLFSTYFNGSQGGSRIAGLALDSQGRAHIAGTGQDDLPVTPSAFLAAVTPAPTNYTYTYGFAALIDVSQPGPGICFSNSSAALADLGASTQSSFSITNCGNAPLTISNVQFPGPVFTPAASGTTCPTTLAPAASCMVAATFTPTVAGTVSGTVSVSSNAPVPVYSITLSGFATAPVINLQPSTAVFSPQVLGNSATATTATVTVYNSGTSNLTVFPSQATITGDFSILTNTCSAPLQPTSQGSTSTACSFVLAFSPTALGTRTGVLSIASSDPVHPVVTVPVSGVAISAYSLPAVTSLSPYSIPVGSVNVTLLVSGTGFFPASFVTINGQSVQTTYLGPALLQVSLPASLLNTMQELEVGVTNPSPGGASGTAALPIYQSLPYSAAGLVYDAATQMLYASLPAASATNANTVMPINPATGAVGTPIPVGNDPAKLAVSSDGTKLFVALRGDHALQRIDVATATVERTFPITPDPSFGPLTIFDMHAVPGSPLEVVASLSRNASPSEAGAALFGDAGIVSFLDNGFDDKNYDVDAFTFTSDPTVFYAFPFNGAFFSKTGVSATALTILTQPGAGCCNEVTGSEVVSDGMLLYTNSGQVWDPLPQTLLGTYVPPSGNPLFYEAGVLPSTADKHTYILDFGGSAASIFSFNQQTYTQIGSAYFSLTEGGSPLDLNRWGADGFAFHVYSGAYGTSSAGDEIVLFRSSLAQQTAIAPTLNSLSPNGVPVGSPDLLLTLNGTGFQPGATVLFGGNTFATTYVSATQLTAVIPASQFNSPGGTQVSVVNPASAGNSAALVFTVQAPGLSVSTTNVLFNSVAVGGAPANSTVTVTNTGTAPLSGIAILTVYGPTSASFGQTSTCNVTLAPNATCVITLSFMPTTTGTQSAVLLVSASSTGTQEVDLSGVGLTATPTLTFSGISSHTFGDPPFTLSATSASPGVVTYSVVSGPATIAGATVSLTGAGTVVIAANQAAVGAFGSAAASTTIQVAQAGTAVSLASSAAMLATGQSLTLTASVASPAGPPTGTVEFINGMTVLATATLKAGVASVTTAALPGGSYSFTAVYSGDVNFAVSTSATVIATVVTPNFSVAVAPSTLSIKQGGSGTAVFTVTPTGGYNQAISFACSGLPSGATCSFAPATLVPAGAPLSTTLIVSTSSPTASNKMHTTPGRQERDGIVFALLAGCGAFARRRKRFALVSTAVCCFAMLSLLGGCGSGPSTPSPSQPVASPGTPVGTYSVSVAASVGESALQGATLNITITP